MLKFGGPALLGLSMFCLCAAAQETAEVRGTVVNAITHQPIRGVQVNFEFIERGAMRQLAFGAQTTNTGAFSITGMKPGTYFITLKSPGLIFVRGVEKDALPTPAVTLKAGEKRDDLRLEMVPFAVVTGRAANEEGEPVAARIDAELVDGRTYVGWRDSAYADTDDRGIYQLFLMPGQYTIKADPITPDSDEPEEIRTDGTSEAGYHGMYWQNAARKTAATAVEALPGRERANVDFRFAHLPALSIAGTISGIPAGASAVQLKLATFEEDDPEIEEEDQIPVAADGKFSATHLDPGRYRLYAACRMEDKQLRTPMREVHLTDSSVTIDLPLGPGMELSGKVEMAAAGPTSGLTVRLESASSTRGWGPSQTTPVAADGWFHMTGIQPDRYRVLVLPQSAEQYLTVKVEGEIARHEVLDLNATSESDVRIAVNRDGGQITGRMESKAEVLNRGFGVIELFPDGDYDWDAVRWQEAGKDGSFTFEGLRPGKYRLVALDFLSGGTYSLEKVRAAAAQAEAIEVHEGEKVTRNAKTIE